MEVIDSFVEVTLPNSDSFLVVKETLSRIGILSTRTNTLWQSCHILHKQGKYYIPHFKEMFMLDGKETEFSDEDLARRNAIVKLLSDWGLVKVVDPSKIASNGIAVKDLKIIPFSAKKDYHLRAKYTLGKR